MSISWLFESHPAPSQLVSGGGTMAVLLSTQHCLTTYQCVCVLGFPHAFQAKFSQPPRHFCQVERNGNAHMTPEACGL